jgi:prolyl oligopeptidase
MSLRPPLLLALLAVACASVLRPPATRTSPDGDVLGGVWVADPYRWLEDDRNPEVVAWAQEQGARTRRYLDALPTRPALRAALEAASGYARMGAPWRRGSATFVMRNAGRQPHDVLWVSEAGLDAARVLLDPNELGPRRALAALSASRDGRHLAYAVSESGTDWQTWHVRDVATGADLADTVAESKFSGAAWVDAPRGFYYTHYPRPAPEASLNTRDAQAAIRFHALGTPESADREVFRHPDPAYTLDAQTTDDGRWLLLYARPGDDKRDVVYARPATAWDAPFRAIVPELTGRWVLAGSDATALWLVTTAGAPRGRLTRLSMRPGKGEAAEDVTVVTEGPDTLLSASRMGERFVLHTLRDARAVLTAVDSAGRSLGELPLPGAGSVDGLDAGGTDEAWFSFANPTTPPEIWHVDARDLTVQRVFAPTLAIDSPPLVTEQAFVNSGDGTRVSVFISHAAALRRDGRHRVRLFGYGGFNAPVRPTFSAADYVWMARGGVYASAVIRGGGEYGDAWHLAGTKVHKQNVFDDFYAIAAHLAREGYGTPRSLGIEGGSNGGLLVAASMTQHPDAFGAVVARAGVLDMLRYERFTCGKDWVPDYGSVTVPEELAALRAYSPLQAVRPGTAYPATLVLTGDHDDRVVPAHSFKFAAALQHAQAGAAPILLGVIADSGHGAGRTWAQRLDDAADKLAFFEANLAL